MSNNQTGKYLKYALGEILLVVIGILIALQINNWNQSRQNKQKVDNLLMKVQNDIETDVSEIIDLTRAYAQKDSLCRLVVSNSLTTEDYAAPGANSLFVLTLSSDDISLKKNSYDNLMRSQDIIPKAYDSIIEQLTSLYTTDYNRIELSRQLFNNRVIKNIEDLHEEFSWFAANAFNDLNDEQFDFLLNSKKYRSMVKLYQGIAIENYVRQNALFMLQSLSIHEDINKIVKNENATQLDSLFLPIDTSKLGAYKSITGDTILYELKNKRPYLSDSDESEQCIQYAPNQFYIPSNSLYLRIETKADGTHMYINAYENGTQPFATKID